MHLLQWTPSAEPSQLSGFHLPRGYLILGGATWRFGFPFGESVDGPEVVCSIVSAGPPPFLSHSG